MPETGSSISAIKEYYQAIFTWYQKNGQFTLDKIIRTNNVSNWTDDRIAQYKAAIEEMPYPEKATAEEIYAVAEKIRRGILERDYGEKISGDLSLGSVSEQILELYEKIKRDEAFEWLKSSVIAIDYNIPNDGEYFERANEIYKNILLKNEQHLGGRVALVDTNLEYERLSPGEGGYKFRKPEYLNFEELPKGSIYDLVMEGYITIESINVKK